MKRLTPLVLWLTTLTVVASVMLFFEVELLWKVQQHNVFLHTSLFFHQMMTVPGGMLSYLAAYFTQHFFYPWVGVILLCGWWLLLMWLTKRAFNIPDRWIVATQVPVAVLLIANMNLGYWIYFMKLPGYFYVATIGTTAATALLWTFRSMPENKWMRAAFIVLVTIVGYPLMGVYALAAVVLMAVLVWRHSSRFLLGAVALVSVILFPLLYYRFVYSATNIIDIWRTAIPVFELYESYPTFYLPYYALAVCFLLMAVTYRAERPEQKTTKTKGIPLKPRAFLSPLISYLSPLSSSSPVASIISGTRMPTSITN